MKLSKKTCAGCNELKYIKKRIEGKPYCSYCVPKSKQPAFSKPKKKIAPRSKKKITLDKQYSVLRKDFLNKNPNCQGSIVGCTRISTDVHHKSYRGENYLKVDTWASLCRNCHDWVHLNSKEARTLNLLE